MNNLHNLLLEWDVIELPLLGECHAPCKFKANLTRLSMSGKIVHQPILYFPFTCGSKNTHASKNGEPRGIQVLHSFHTVFYALSPLLFMVIKTYVHLSAAFYLHTFYVCSCVAMNKADLMLK